MSRAPWRDDYLVFGRPHIGPEERAEIAACIDSLWLGTGPRVTQFERDFATYIGEDAANVVAVSSCTAALHLSLRQLGLPEGSEVIVPALTFGSTANAVVHAGLRPVFADCDRQTMNLDAADVATRITARTGAILAVHFAGRPCDMNALGELARTHGLAMIEDCAHAIEATIDGRHCGRFGSFGCFSFYVTKNVTTVEGGMVVCRDRATAETVRTAAHHGLSAGAWARYSDGGHKHYEVVDPGYKYNLTDLAASLGLHQLARIEGCATRRAELWAFYLDQLADLPLVLPCADAPNTRHARHLFACLIDDARTSANRDEVVKAMHDLRIGTGVHYTALHLHRYYRETYGYKEGDLPGAEHIGARTFSIPLSAAVTERDANDVVRALREVLGGS